MPLELKEVGRYAFLQVPESEKISTWQQTSGYGEVVRLQVAIWKK